MIRKPSFTLSQMFAARAPPCNPLVAPVNVRFVRQYLAPLSVQQRIVTCAREGLDDFDGHVVNSDSIEAMKKLAVWVLNGKTSVLVPVVPQPFP